MLQRIMIAIAISCNPRLLIADEPTTALDVTIQAQILDMLQQIKSQSGTSILMITHDLGVVAEMADYVVVMYAGKVVEEGKLCNCLSLPNIHIPRDCFAPSRLSINGRMNCIRFPDMYQTRYL